MDHPTPELPADLVRPSDPEYVVEWGLLMLDCGREGCQDRHGHVFDILPTRPEEPTYSIRRHPTVVVSRSVHYLPWCRARSDGRDDASEG